MSEEQLKAFIEKVKADTSLQEKLKAAGDADSVVAIAKEAGFMISADDLTKAQSEVSEEELERRVVAGKDVCYWSTAGNLNYQTLMYNVDHATNRHGRVIPLRGRQCVF